MDRSENDRPCDGLWLLTQFDRTTATGFAGSTMSRNESEPASWYRAGLMNPRSRPAAWFASAIVPANNGDERLVPPMRYSSYLYPWWWKYWVSPTRNPVFGSPTAATSGTTRFSAP